MIVDVDMDDIGFVVDIKEAVARGWCSKRNEKKIMDVALAEDIAEEVLSVVDTAKVAPECLKKTELCHLARSDSRNRLLWSYGNINVVEPKDMFGKNLCDLPLGELSIFQLSQLWATRTSERDARAIETELNARQKTWKTGQNYESRVKQLGWSDPMPDLRSRF